MSFTAKALKAESAYRNSIEATMDLQEFARIDATSNTVTPQGRAEILKFPLERRSKAYTSLLTELHEMETAAAVAEVAARPSQAQRRKAIESVEGTRRAGEVRALVRGARAPEVLAIAKQLRAAGDAAGMYGIRQEIAGRLGEMAAEDVAAIHSELDADHIKIHESAVADLVSVQWLRSRIELEGPLGSDPAAAVLGDPTRALNIANRTATYEGEHGNVHLNSQQLQAMLAQTGAAEAVR